jgi:8-oxo-dGTP pyrophosphatase MutT (NUDIX family)
VSEGGRTRQLERLPSAPAVAPDRLWHRALIVAVRLRAWIMWSVYTSGALAVVHRDDGRLLLVKPRYRSGWGFVGGYLKPGEQPADAMRRELAEEVGVRDAEIGAPVGSYVQHRRRHIDHLFVVFLSDAALVPRRIELADAQWFAPAELPELQPEARQALNELGLI